MRWEVFKQDAPNKPHQAVGSVHGADPEHALLNARHVFGRRPSAVSMWVVRADDVYSRTAEELSAEELSAPEPGAVEPGAAEPGGAEPGAAEPGATEPVTARREPAEAAGAPRTYHVFRKSSHKRSMTFADHLTDVRSTEPGGALRLALAEVDEPGLAWWVVARDDVHATDQDAPGSWFEPARDKTYKQQSQYGTVAPEGTETKNAVEPKRDREARP